jgi:hypothetical protein
MDNRQHDHDRARLYEFAFFDQGDTMMHRG